MEYERLAVKDRGYKSAYLQAIFVELTSQLFCARDTSCIIDNSTARMLAIRNFNRQFATHIHRLLQCRPLTASGHASQTGAPITQADARRARQKGTASVAPALQALENLRRLPDIGFKNLLRIHERRGPRFTRDNPEPEAADLGRPPSRRSSSEIGSDDPRLVGQSTRRRVWTDCHREARPSPMSRPADRQRAISVTMPVRVQSWDVKFGSPADLRDEPARRRLARAPDAPLCKSHRHIRRLRFARLSLGAARSGASDTLRSIEELD